MTFVSDAFIIDPNLKLLVVLIISLKSAITLTILLTISCLQTKDLKALKILIINLRFFFRLLYYFLNHSFDLGILTKDLKSDSFILRVWILDREG
jgi:hypothetical protein